MNRPSDTQFMQLVHNIASQSGVFRKDCIPVMWDILNRHRLIESEEGSHASIRCEDLRDASGAVCRLSARFGRRAALAPVTDDRHSLPWRDVLCLWRRARANS